MKFMLKMWNEIMEQPSVLERCRIKNDQVIREIVKGAKARNIHSVYLAARGTSGHASVYGKYVLELTAGVPVALAFPSVFTIYGEAVNLSNSLVLGISQSGKAADVMEVIKNANRQGAITVGITNFPDSPLAKESKFHLCCEAGPELSVAATKTFMAQIYLLANLAAEWGKSSTLQKQLALVPEKLNGAFEISKIIGEKAERYRFMNECFVLARGINYAIALEAALKIQETTYARAKAFATSEFQHGPIAMVEKDLPVMIFAPEGPSLAYTKEMIDTLRKKQVELIIVSNNKEILGLGNSSFAIPDTDNDIISPFLNTAVAQMFACRLAVAKGLNPDSPRELSKVTITM
jgi:glucosamine--fructose-6-phosphate aminotransferase (isomerizing)